MFLNRLKLFERSYKFFLLAFGENADHLKCCYITVIYVQKLKVSLLEFSSKLCVCPEKKNSWSKETFQTNKTKYIRHIPMLSFRFSRSNSTYLHNICNLLLYDWRHFLVKLQRDNFPLPCITFPRKNRSNKLTILYSSPGSCCWKYILRYIGSLIKHRNILFKKKQSF